MDQFKKNLKSKIIISVGGMMSCVTIVLISRNMVAKDIRIDLIFGIQLGIILSFELLFLFKIIKYKKALNDEKILKKLYVKENDERSIFIDKKAATLVLYLSLATLAVVTIVAGFFNSIVFFTLLSVLGFIIITKSILYMYYKKKI